MKRKVLISLFTILCIFRSELSLAGANEISIHFDFYGTNISFQLNKSFVVDFNVPLSGASIETFNGKLSEGNFQPVVKALVDYKEKHKPDDWLFYQLIRKTAQQISPKAENYHRYTLYKWFLLRKSGYDAILTFSKDKLLLYVKSDENIYNIPSRMQDSKQYVCLNYHDYGTIDFEKEIFTQTVIQEEKAKNSFSYKITQLPNFRNEEYVEKDLRFNYYENDYHFKVKLNPQVKSIFANYPVVDYESYLNIPMSRETYSSLIPLLRKNIKGLSVKNGVDYLMRFTRYAFVFEPDSKTFGQEKRLSPEQTLLYEYSDCEDRVALFFYLVKEIYDLPMVVLAFPKHITIAVKFDKTFGRPILYNGMSYSVCEPTPQKKDLNVGELLPKLRRASYEIAYAYTPKPK